MFDQLSIRYKLAILLGTSTTVALLISLVAVLYVTLQVEKEASLNNLHQVADIINENIQAAVAFHDSESAEKILNSLRSNKNILFALVENSQFEALGKYFSEQVEPENLEKIERIQANAKHHLQELSDSSINALEEIDKNFHCVAHKIILEDEVIGTILIVSDNEAMYSKMRRFTWLLAAIASVVVVCIALVSLRLQKIFTRPIYRLLDSMREIAKTKNYKTELASQRQDEFKELYQGFNNMLVEIYRRDEKLNNLATTDPLTKLSNRSFTVFTIKSLIPKLLRKQQPLSVILLDIDLFKNINDTHGHALGDQVLRSIAQILQVKARPYDIVARWGGEEFLVVCEETNQSEAIVIAERMRQAIEAKAILLEDGTICNVTASFGVYSSVPTQSFSMMVDYADKALYAAKAAGRNCVKTWGDDAA